MSMIFSTNGGEEESIQDIGGKPEGKRQLGDQDVSGWIILK
jgi:hypothetical protein